MPLAKLKDFLNKEKVEYVIISHATAYTAQDIAASAHIPGKGLAKTVMVKIDDQMAMVVLPASYKVDFDLLRQASGATKVEMATEDEFKGLFPKCNVGAMPPFGNLYGIPVYVAQSLTEEEDIAFNAGSHSELVKLRYKDFERLVKPTVARLSFKVHAKV